MMRKFVASAFDRVADSLSWRLAERQQSRIAAATNGSAPPVSDEATLAERLHSIETRVAQMQEQIWKINQHVYNMDVFDYRNIVKQAHHIGSQSSTRYWIQHMQKATGFPNRDDVMFYGVDRASAEGQWLEFGVFTGGSLTGIANRRPDITIHGFDSFEGLPESWAFNPKGTFTQDGRLPKVPANARLHKGWYDETAPAFFRENREKISFLHIDCDMYSSTKTVFDNCWDLLRPGTIIEFDEYWNYVDWEQHEFRAFQEMVKERGIQYEYLAYCTVGEMVCVRITATPS